MITTSNSSSRRSGTPNQLLDVLPHTMAISGLSRVRTELDPLLIVPLLSKEEGKGASAPEKNAKALSGRWEGIVTGSDKNRSTLTVRRRDGFVRVIHYDGSTQWTSQEHHSSKINSIDASQLKSDDRVICVGFYDAKGEFQAAMISKRLSK